MSHSETNLNQMETQKTNNEENPNKPTISIKNEWNILMKSIEDKTGIKGYYIILLILICLILIHFGIFESLITNLVGTAYPGFCTIKAIETKSLNKKYWLTYWLVFGTFLIVDKFSGKILKIIPFYFVLKILFLIWMYFPGINGCAIIYNLLLKKLFVYLDSNVDNYLKEIKFIAKNVKGTDVGKKIYDTLLKLPNIIKNKNDNVDISEDNKFENENGCQTFQSNIIYEKNPFTPSLDNNSYNEMTNCESINFNNDYLKNIRNIDNNESEPEEMYEKENKNENDNIVENGERKNFLIKNIDNNTSID